MVENPFIFDEYPQEEEEQHNEAFLAEYDINEDFMEFILAHEIEEKQDLRLYKGKKQGENC